MKQENDNCTYFRNKGKKICTIVRIFLLDFFLLNFFLCFLGGHFRQLYIFSCCISVVFPLNHTPSPVSLHHWKGGPASLERALYLCKRALHLCKRNLDFPKRALHLRKRALHFHKRALYLRKRTPHLRKRALYFSIKRGTSDRRWGAGVEYHFQKI